DDQSSLETVTSMDQLLQLFYPEYSLIQQCMRKRSWHASSSSSSFPSSSFSTSSVSPLVLILEEIQRTSCQPREVCVEVAKEYPESTSQLYLPRCVALHRCGGCCGNEAFYCTNTSYSLVNKTLMELSPPRMDRSVAMVTFVNHTSCECLSKRPLHSIIRRAATDHLCSPPEVPCTSGSLWDPVNCVCVSALDSGLLALCGPNRVLEESTCECVCQNGLTEASCYPGWKLDQNTCKETNQTSLTAEDNRFRRLCGCVCAVECPRNQPLNPDTCLCQCRESPQTCLRQGKRFNPNTCSNCNCIETVTFS
uniref:Vascular endothelial growth factor C-like n=1 Tax=Poecilia latipinna TaxID=48699 RepID=A0A3B3V262_9TELE